MPKNTLPAVDAFTPEINIGRQDAIARHYAKIGKHKVRVEIRSDAYDFQSYARIHVWRDATLDWSLVHHLHHKAMKTPYGLAYQRVAQPASLTPYFRLDADELLRVAREILL